jgi:uncharacterized protein (DUF1684 family)
VTALSTDPGETLDLLDWKRRIFALYGEIRAAADPKTAWNHWRDVRDELFRTHPSSPVPVEERASFPGSPFYGYDPALRMLATVDGVTPSEEQVASSGTEAIAFARFAVARFDLAGEERALELYWLTAYGGGLFVPFRDATSGGETYGGGRYLLDTVKGSDLGMVDGRLVLDFNFAYNPSCSYDPRWVCPLSPPANRLPVPVHAGERMPG